MEIKSFTPKNKTMKIKSHSNIKDSINIQDNYNNSNDNKEICNKSTINEYTYNAKSTKKIKKIFEIFKKNKKKMEIISKRKLNSFFNKNYLKKRNYIKNIEDKELKFQKL